LVIGLFGDLSSTGRRRHGLLRKSSDIQEGDGNDRADGKYGTRVFTLPQVRHRCDMRKLARSIAARIIKANSERNKVDKTNERKCPIMLIMNKRVLISVLMLFLALSNIAVADYTDNGNGTVTDTVTSLSWQQQDDAIMKTWEQAITYCEGLSLGSHTDWRLPNIKELKSIADMSRYNPAINPLFNTKSSDYWSSTTDVNSTTYAWYVNFYLGYVGVNYKTDYGYVRCVR
jgi:hypothetical protein